MSKRIAIDFPDDLHLALTAVAKNDRRSKNKELLEIIDLWLTDYLSKHDIVLEEVKSELKLNGFTSNSEHLREIITGDGEKESYLEEKIQESPLS